MLTNAIPASAPGLPVVSTLVQLKPLSTQPASKPELATWAASIGRTVADVAALMFRLPIPGHLRSVFEDSVRQEVSAALLAMDGVVAVDEADRLETIAWLAFDRRLGMHVANRHEEGQA